MHHFAYRDGLLHAEAVSLAALADDVGTPFYCYSTATLERHYKVFAGAFADVPSLVCYAMKANSNQAVLQTLAKLGCAPTLCRGRNGARGSRHSGRKIMFSGIGRASATGALDEHSLCIKWSRTGTRSAFFHRAAKGRSRRSIRSIPMSMPDRAKIATGRARTNSAFR